MFFFAAGRDEGAFDTIKWIVKKFPKTTLQISDNATGIKFNYKNGISRRLYLQV